MPNVIGNPPSLAAFFEVWRRNPGEFLCLEGDRGTVRVTYADAGTGAANFAARLRAEGIARGERLVIWGENRPEWVVALWGCLLEGVIAVPVDFRSSATIVSSIIRITSARALLTGPDLEPPVDCPCPVWRLTGVLGGGDTSTAGFSPAEPGQIAEILFTSGATGAPRGVTLTHRNILANLKPIDHEIDKYRKYMGPFAPIRFLNLLPLSHMFGQSMAALIPPMIAGEVFFQPGYSPREAAHLIRHRRISVMVCVPQMLDLLRDYILATFPDAAAPPRSRKWYARWWQYRRIHRHFGWKFWAFVVGAAALDASLEEFWGKLGFVVIQGYGLTETAPVATLNHPFHASKGSVGKPIGGVEIRIAPDGEVLLRGDNVTPGYYGDSSVADNACDSDGFLHTGDIGELSPDGHLKILGRKKEMIISPDGLNVYPEDVERVLNAEPGVRESAVVASREGTREFVHAVLVLEPPTSPETVVKAANGLLETHQRIRGFSVWPADELPRTSGTRKLKRVEIAQWVAGAPVPARPAEGGSVEEIIARFAGRAVSPGASLEELGLSSLDRIQLLMELEQRTGGRVNETAFAAAQTVADLSHMQPAADSSGDFEFPEWNRSLAARALRRVALPPILFLARLFAWVKVTGLENLRSVNGPVIFASNHQSHLDVPAILWALPPRWRYRLAPAMAKEFFSAHFHPKGHKRIERFTSSLNYYLACLVFDAFPLPQRESGTREALRYAGQLVADGYSILIFPEGKRTDAGELSAFRAGTAMLASRLNVTVIPVCLTGLEKILHKTARFPTPGPARVRFGKPLHLAGDNYPRLAEALREAVAELI